MDSVVLVGWTKILINSISMNSPHVFYSCINIVVVCFFGEVGRQ